MKSGESQDISKFAALLSLVEVGLGSFLHSLHIPMSGQILSLNQGFVLSRVVLSLRDKMAGNSVSMITAVLKSLSPAGKKLTPMLAISMQGILFTLGPLVFGINLIGLVLGMTLLCLWAYLQPLLLYYFMYGKTLADVGQYFFEQIQEIIHISTQDLLAVLMMFVIIKVVIGWGLVILALRLSPEMFDKYLFRLSSLGRVQSTKKKKPFDDSKDVPKEELRASHAKLEQSGADQFLTMTNNIAFAQNVSSEIFRQRGMNGKAKNAYLALKDLFRPIFVLSLVLTGIFFFVTGQSTVSLVWALLRPIAVGFLIFFLFRLIPFEKFLNFLEKTRFKSFAQSVSQAIKYLNR